MSAKNYTQNFSLKHTPPPPHSSRVLIFTTCLPCTCHTPSNLESAPFNASSTPRPSCLFSLLSPALADMTIPRAPHTPLTPLYSLCVGGGGGRERERAGAPLRLISWMRAGPVPQFSPLGRRGLCSDCGTGAAKIARDRVCLCVCEWYRFVRADRRCRAEPEHRERELMWQGCSWRLESGWLMVGLW